MSIAGTGSPQPQWGLRGLGSSKCCKTSLYVTGSAYGGRGNLATSARKGSAEDTPRGPKPMGKVPGAATPRRRPQNDPCSMCVLLRAVNPATTGAKSVKGLTHPCAASARMCG